ncbi:MAG: hypothetical protein ABIP97_06720 [Chthoniobacterales bacterium]
MNVMEPAETLRRAHSIRDALPEGGLFHEKSWRIAPSAFPIDEPLAEEIEKLGYRLLLFVRACNLLYRQSIKGRQPAWIAEWLDRGKPKELVEWSRERAIQNDLPRVLRPDLILTERGFVIAEVDNVPGGIGLTAWLNREYAALGDPVIGGANGMLEGFGKILPGGDILVSDEASTYRPEMEWLAKQLNGSASDGKNWRVLTTDAGQKFQSNVYRFFELFDFANIACLPELVSAMQAEEVSVTPPLKPYLEEKMWFALFWLRPLHEFWRRELSERHFEALKQVIPYTWMLDPQPLPPVAVYPHLEINDWKELTKFSQKERELILKVSGFSERAWGSRGVFVGSDLSSPQWRAAIEAGLTDWKKNPHILQRFQPGKLVDHFYLDEESGEVVPMKGRVRICPYYFIAEERTTCSGILATICPPDKKLLHGMGDAILAPVCASPE